MSRTRQLFPADVFERLFDHVFAQCVAQGLVAGDTQAVDSAPVKANSSLEAVREKHVTGPHGSFLVTGEPAAPAPAHQLPGRAARQARLVAHSNVPSAQHPQARLLRNKTHCSPTNPDVRISLKPGKAQALNYCHHLAVDTA